MEHPNFVIDDMVDKYVKTNFQSIFEGCLETLQNAQVSVDEKSNLALHQVFDYKENCKLQIKYRDAEEIKLRKRENKEKQHTLRNNLRRKWRQKPENLLKSCLINNMEDYILSSILDSNPSVGKELDECVPQYFTAKKEG